MLDTELKKWWAALPDDQIAALKDAAEAGRMDPLTLRLLIETGCPDTPMGAKWENQREIMVLGWPDCVRNFIAAQSE